MWWVKAPFNAWIIEGSKAQTDPCLGWDQGPCLDGPWPARLLLEHTAHHNTREKVGS